MRFLAITLITHAPDPLTGVLASTQERFRQVVEHARLAEELGFDGFGVGERHERPFISSSPPVVLSHSPRSPARSGCSPPSPRSACWTRCAPTRTTPPSTTCRADGWS